MRIAPVSRLSPVVGPLVAPALALVLVSVVGGLGACSGAAKPQGRYPARPEGCDVKTFPEAPAVPIDNIGPVTATCAENVTNDDCMRTLKDEACKLGGDVVWGVDDIPSNKLGKKHLAGRAAHTKQAGPAK